MQIFKKSEDDVHGFIPYSIGLSVIIITCTCVAGGTMLSQIAQDSNSPVIAWLKNKPEVLALAKTNSLPRFDNVDRTATGSVTAALSRPVVLDPCTGKTK